MTFYFRFFRVQMINPSYDIIHFARKEFKEFLQIHAKFKLFK